MTASDTDTRTPWRAVRPGTRGFTLLEVMVSVAILAIAVVPMLLTRERCYDMAYDTKIQRMLQDLAQQKLADIALTVIDGDEAGEIEGAPGFSYSYEVTIYDFQSGLDSEEEDEEERDSRLDTFNAPGDAVFADNDFDQVHDLMARHVILKIYAPDEGDGKMEEYVIDTYLPLLMTEEQFKRYGSDNQDDF
jgi:prepilin-type N-terminal cleavage/methylation domain-containing protein